MKSDANLFIEKAVRKLIKSLNQEFEKQQLKVGRDTLKFVLLLEFR